MSPNPKTVEAFEHLLEQSHFNDEGFEATAKFMAEALEAGEIEGYPGEIVTSIGWKDEAIYRLVPKKANDE